MMPPTVKKWVTEFMEFEHGRQRFEDDARPGRPVAVATQETVNEVHYYYYS